MTNKARQMQIKTPELETVEVECLNRRSFSVLLELHNIRNGTKFKTIESNSVVL